MQNHIVIVGSGIAGLSLALKLSQSDATIGVTLITKAALNDCNTRYAQGGVAAVINTQFDSFESHISDTLLCGKGLCDESVVEMVVKQAPARIEELVKWGTQFDKNNSSSYDKALEGGHSHARVLHHKDLTGFEIESVLITQIKLCKNIKVLENHIAIDLLIARREGKEVCTGIEVFDCSENKIQRIHSSKIVLATGGCGQVYLNTTNPVVATGDGYAIAARAGARLRDMRFMQFHPTALFSENRENVSFLISEALRGFGAHIIDKQQERFLFNYDTRGELATRDIVSSAIMDHLHKTSETCVYMDLRHLDKILVENHFPYIIKQFKSLGYDFRSDLIPVVPSAHYQCGGILVNNNGLSSIDNLYAIGEVSSTGLHGANRLASNSLLEALVYAHNASQDILNTLSEHHPKSFQYTEQTVQPFPCTDPLIIKYTLLVKKTMSATAFMQSIYDFETYLQTLKEIENWVETELSHNRCSLDLLNLRSVVKTAEMILLDIIHAAGETTKAELMENKHLYEQ